VCIGFLRKNWNLDHTSEQAKQNLKERAIRVYELSRDSRDSEEVGDDALEEEKAREILEGAVFIQKKETGLF